MRIAFVAMDSGRPLATNTSSAAQLVNLENCQLGDSTARDRSPQWKNSLRALASLRPLSTVVYERRSRFKHINKMASVAENNVDYSMHLLAAKSVN